MEKCDAVDDAGAAIGYTSSATTEFNTAATSTRLLTRAELNELLPWGDAYFNGNSKIDGHEKIWIAIAVHNMLIHNEIGSGVRIQFMPKSYYKDLVFVINMMSQEGVRR